MNDESITQEIKILTDHEAKLLKLIELRHRVLNLQMGVMRSGCPLTNEILTEVSRTYMVDIDQLLSRNFAQRFSHPRQICYYLIRKLTELSFNEIGRLFGRNHGTIMHGCKHIQGLMDVDTELRAMVNGIRDRVCLNSVEEIESFGAEFVP